MSNERTKTQAAETLRRWCPPGTKIFYIVWARSGEMTVCLVTFYGAYTDEGGYIRLKWLDGLINRALPEYPRRGITMRDTVLGNTLEDYGFTALKEGLLLEGYSAGSIGEFVGFLSQFLWGDTNAFDSEAL